MAEVEAIQLKSAVEARHGGTAILVQSVPVMSPVEGQKRRLWPSSGEGDE